MSESATRASLYVLSLSSSLVALGFVSESTRAFGPFLSVVLPTVFALGLFTTVRLVDTGVQNVGYLRSMARIRHYWAGLTPDAPTFFGPTASDETREALASLAVRYGPIAELFTIASMIATVNSVVGGTGVALFVANRQGGDDGHALPVVIGVVTGLAVEVLFVAYQHRRYQVHAVPAAGESTDQPPVTLAR